jgi:hypothetical protein
MLRFRTGMAVARSRRATRTALFLFGMALLIAAAVLRRMVTAAPPPPPAGPSTGQTVT